MLSGCSLELCYVNLSIFANDELHEQMFIRRHLEAKEQISDEQGILYTVHTYKMIDLKEAANGLLDLRVCSHFKCRLIFSTVEAIVTVSL